MHGFKNILKLFIQNFINFLSILHIVELID